MKDIQGAADMLRAGLRPHGRRDGYVSLEVSPYLAHDTRRHDRGSAAACGRPLARPNVMIKVPGTRRGGARHPRRSSARGSTSTSRCCSAARCTRRWRGPTSTAWRRARPSGAADDRSHGQRGQLLRQPHRHRGRRAARRALKAADRRRASARSSAARQGRDRQRQARLPELQADLRRPALGGAGSAGRAHRSACCGPAPAPRIPRYRDVLYVEELIGPDTVDTCRPRRSTRSAITAARARASRGLDGRAGRRSTTLERAGISLRAGHRRAARRRRPSCSRRRSTSCSTAVERRRREAERTPRINQQTVQLAGRPRRPR